MNDTPLTPALLLSAVGAMRPYSRERMAQEILLAILHGDGLIDRTEAKAYIRDYLNAIDDALKPDA